MKKLSLIALAVVAVMLFAGTAMALDVSWTGQYRVRGYYMKNMALADDSDDCGFPAGYVGSLGRGLCR